MARRKGKANQERKPRRLKASRWGPIRRRWRDYQWYAVGGLWIIALSLGYVGFSRYFSAAGESVTGLDIFYRTLQLIVLESGAVSGSVPWQLQVARWLVPAVAALTAIQALAAVFYEQVQRFRVRILKGHVVICGVGRKGLLLSREFRRLGYPVVVIEQDEENSMLEQCKDEGAVVLAGNAADPELLRKARVHRARYLISVCGDDGANAEVAMNARKLVENSKGGVLTCLVHIADLQMCDLIREQEIYLDKADNFRLEFFNVFESGARALVREFPAFDGQPEPGRPGPRLLVVGLGRFGQSLAAHMAMDWVPIYQKTGERLRISVLDWKAERKREFLREENPYLDEVWDLRALQVDIDSPEYRRAEFLFDPEGRRDVSGIYVCLDDDSRALSAALALLRRLRDPGVPIVVRMTHDAGLAALLKGEIGDIAFSSLHAFGLLDRTCKPDLLFGGVHEILARAIHEEYVRNRREEGDTPEKNPSLVPWDELPEYLKESNRSQTGYMGAQLKTVGCGIEPLTCLGEELFRFTGEEVELLAELEHKRWTKERRDSGWTYAPGLKDQDRMTSPHLVPWEELTEEIKEYDREAVRGMPSFLARAGFRIRRLNARGAGAPGDAAG